MENFEFFNADKIHCFLYQNHSIDIKDFLSELSYLLKQVTSLVRDINSPNCVVCAGIDSVTLILNTLGCSECYSRMLRRKLAINTFERFPAVSRYSVTQEKITFFLENF